tara:strand:- start:1214 stop:1885 length:672 start_codon:yes stop_codon:yes gene_type:complete
VVGNGEQGSTLQGRSTSRNVALNSPWDISVNGYEFYFANAGTHQIGVLDIGGSIVASFAGTGAERLENGPRLQGVFAQPSGLFIGEEKIFLADSETSAILSVRFDNAGCIETYIGTGLFDFGDQNGYAEDAMLQHPMGIYYSQGRVYIADTYNNKIKVLDLKSQQVTTVLASVDLICEDGSCTRLLELAGVIELNRKLYISDTNNHRILKIDLGTQETKIFIR